jgi:hypothetical protein
VLLSGASLAAAQEPPMPRLAPTHTASPATPESGGADNTIGANSPLAAEVDPGAVPEGALPFADQQSQLELRPTTDEEAAPVEGELDVPLDDLPLAGEGEGPALAPDAGPPTEIRPGTFTLEARLAVDGPPLGAGVKWRIFGDAPGPDGHLPLLGEAEGGIIYIRLDQGTYYVHAAYGRAGATRKIVVDGPTGGEVVVLNAGGMRLLAINGEDQNLARGDVAFDIYAPDEGGTEERYLLVPDAPPGVIIPLTAGVYHVVSKYGDANAVVRADVKIDPGKLTEATVYQNAARLTLKLVEQHGGEAIADTAWSVVTSTGERVLESVGAFPSVVLAKGDYTAVARHDERTFQANFSVVPGINRDIEVIAE